MIELLILYVISKREYTMYGIRKRITDYFGVYLRPSFGALKPALKRLEEKEFIATRKIISSGGKLSVFYEITKNGIEELKRLVLEDFGSNPVHFFSNARVRIICSDCLNSDEKKRLFFSVKTMALMLKNEAKNMLEDEYKQKNFYHKIVLDNTICEYANFITIIEGLEKDNARNS